MEEKRKEINNLDSKIIKLLAKRRELSREIIGLKNKSQSLIRNKEREKELLSKLMEIGKEEGLDSYFIKNVYREIINDSIRIQNNIVLDSDNRNDPSSSRVVAIQGIEGSYSYLATKQYFRDTGPEITFNYNENFESIVKAVEEGDADYAMLPIENTTSGSINDVYDVIIDSQLSIVGEEIFHVKHCLVAIEEIALNEIQKISTHIQAARQCSKFLSSIGNTTVEYYVDTAQSVKKIKEENNKFHTAIASEEAAKIFDVVILREKIANQQGNYTRFLLCAKEPITVDRRIPAKTSIIMATAQKPGSLVEALSIFRDLGINMTKLQSRPILGNPWEELFYVDFLGNAADENVQKLMEGLVKHVRFIRMLGCYPSKDLQKNKS